MQLLVVLAVCASVLHAHPLQREWQQWKVEHNRQYDGIVEEESRRDTWLQNHDYIHKHNRNNPVFKLSLNQYADLVS